MLDTGLRFAFAFLPAGVAVLVGLVLAVRRRRVLPEVATPAIWGLVLHLFVALLGASFIVVVPALFAAGWSPDSVLVASSVLGIVLVFATVIAWTLLLTALFRRLPAEAAGASAPTAAVPVAGRGPGRTPEAGFPVAPEPFADDAPTGRHALLDEHGQQVVAQEGVRLYPRAHALAGGAAAGAAAGAAGGFATMRATAPRNPATPGSGTPETRAPEDRTPVTELPTEAVPVVPPPPPPAPDEESAGVTEAALGGVPTVGAQGPGSGTGDAAEAGGAGRRPGAVPPAEPGPGGVDETAVGGVPTSPSPQEEPGTQDGRGPSVDTSAASDSASSSGPDDRPNTADLVGPGAAAATLGMTSVATAGNRDDGTDAGSATDPDGPAAEVPDHARDTGQDDTGDTDDHIAGDAAAPEDAAPEDGGAPEYAVAAESRDRDGSEGEAGSGGGEAGSGAEAGSGDEAGSEPAAGAPAQSVPARSVGGDDLFSPGVPPAAPDTQDRPRARVWTPAGPPHPGTTETATATGAGASAAPTDVSSTGADDTGRPEASGDEPVPDASEISDVVAAAGDVPLDDEAVGGVPATAGGGDAGPEPDAVEEPVEEPEYSAERADPVGRARAAVAGWFEPVTNGESPSAAGDRPNRDHGKV